MSIQGTVYNSKNLQPLAGIPVSDGRHTAFTDEAGHFELPGWERGHLVQLGILTEEHDDWYLPMEGHQGSYDFYISPIETTDSFRFLHISDTELMENPASVFLPELQQIAMQEKAAFLIHTGDICYQCGLRRHYKEVNRRTVGCPVRYLIGNHDYADGPYGEYLYELLYGPTWYSFDYGKIHFVALSIGKGEHKTSGYLPEDQWRWLEEDLKAMKPGQRLILMDHDFCHCDEEGQVHPEGGAPFDLRAADPLAWIFGHLHIHNVQTINGILHIGTGRPDCGGIESSPAGIRSISINGTELKSKMLYRGFKPNRETAPAIWKTKLEGIIAHSAPCTIGEDLIVCTASEDHPCHTAIYRLNGEDGAIQWAFTTQYSIYGDAATDGERVFALDAFGNLYCLNADNGELLWQRYCPRPRFPSSKTGVLLQGDLLYTGSTQIVYAYRKDGTLQWKSGLELGEPSPSRMVADLQNGLLIVGSMWRWLYALDLQRGEVKWVQKDASCITFRTSTPLLDNGMLYTGGTTRFFRINAATGAAEREEDTPYQFDVAGAPKMQDGILYVPTADQGVLAMDPETFRVLRKFPVGPSRLYTPPYLYEELHAVESDLQFEGDTLIFNGMDGLLYFYQKDTAELIKTVCLDAPSLSAPILRKEYFYTAAFDGTVAKYRRA